MPSINSARYTQRIIQTVKSREVEKISRPDKNYRDTVCQSARIRLKEDVGETRLVGTVFTFSPLSPKYLRYRFPIDTIRKGNRDPSSTNIINTLCCHFIRCDRIRCQRHMVELSQPTRERNFFSTLVPGSGRFQLTNLLGYN